MVSGRRRDPSRPRESASDSRNAGSRRPGDADVCGAPDCALRKAQLGMQVREEPRDGGNSVLMLWLEHLHPAGLTSRPSPAFKVK